MPSPRAPKRGRGPVDHVEATRRLDRFEVDRIDDETQVVGVLARARHREQVDDRVRVDAHRREQDLASPPLLDPFRREAELAAVEGERAFDVGDVEHDVVEPGDAQLVRHSLG